jgi:hypothetical protein
VKHVTPFLAALALAATVRAEEEQDPLEAVREALKATEAAGGWTCRGSVRDGGPQGVMVMGGIGAAARPVAGKLRCRGDADGDLEIRVDARDDEVEVTRVGERVTKRATWSGTALDTDAFARDVLRALSWKELRASVKKAKKAKLERGPESDVVTLRLPKSFFQEDSGGAAEDVRIQSMLEDRLFETKSVEASFEIDRASGRLRAMTLEVVRGYGNAIVSAIEEKLGEKGGYGEWEEDGKQEEEEEEEDGGGEGRNSAENFKAGDLRRTFEFKGFEYDESIDVKPMKKEK